MSEELSYPAARVLLFAREPVAGRVKTRLAPLLGEEGALDLYCQLLARQLANLATQRLCNAELWVDGNLDNAAFEDFPGPRRAQVGGDLGARMLAAARQRLDAGQEAVVIIGSDCPALDADYLRAALEALASGEEVVIGPALDGGYVLIGLRRCEPALFRGIDWGSEHVLAQTEARLRESGLRYRLLPPLRDIDRPEDLAGLADYDIFPRVSRPWLAGDGSDRKGES